MGKVGCTIIIVLLIVFVGFGIYIVTTGLGMPTKGATESAGFLLGLWQGAIVVLSFIRSWFDSDVVLYQSANNGFWYNLGFIFGISAAIGGSSSASSNRN